MLQLLRHKKDQSGQAIVLVALLMVILIASLGLAVDGGGMFLLYRDVQNATDAAGLSAAFALCTGDNPDNAVEISARLNGFEDGVDGATITVQHPPTSLGDPAYWGDNRYVAIEIQAEKPSYFIQVVYDGPLEVTSVTVSQCEGEDSYGFPPESALVLLNEANCVGGGNEPLKQQGNSTVYISGNIYVNHNNAACNSVDIMGPTKSHFILDGKLCTQSSAVRTDLNGETLYQSDGTVAEVETDCDDAAQLTGTAATDPLGISGNLPACGPNRGSIDDYAGGTAPPGTYTDLSIGSKKTVTMGSGIYCVTGNSTIHGTLLSEPDGVFIYTQGEIDSNSQAIVDIIAMTDGPYAGLLVYSDIVKTNQAGLKWNGGSDLSLTGTVYAPQTPCQINGGDNTIINSQFICYEFWIEGGGEVMIFYEPAAVYRQPPSFGITQ